MIYPNYGAKKDAQLYERTLISKKSEDTIFLELGAGLTVVEKQKLIIVDDDDSNVDFVFYKLPKSISGRKLVS